MADEDWLSLRPAIHTIRNDGSPITAQRTLSLTGDVAVFDNHGEGQTEVRFAKGGAPARTYTWKESCRLATTANHSLSGLADIDGVTPSASDRILVNAQTAGAENGIYVAAAGAWSRATDFNSVDNAVPGAVVAIEEGTTYAGEPFFLLGPGPIVVGVSPVTWCPITVNDAQSFRGVTINADASGPDSGEVFVEDSGVYNAAHIIDENVSSSAALAVSKIAAGVFPEQLMSGGGGGVEWRAPWLTLQHGCVSSPIEIGFSRHRIQHITICEDTTVTVDAAHDGEFFIVVAQDGAGGHSLTLANSTELIGSTSMYTGPSSTTFYRMVRRNGEWVHEVMRVAPAGAYMNLVQTVQGSQSGCTFESAPTSGNLLVIAAMHSNSDYPDDLGDDNLSDPPSGWMSAVGAVGDAAVAQIFWKVSDGTETTVSWAFLGGAQTAVYMEFNGSAGTPTLFDTTLFEYIVGEWSNGEEKTFSLSPMSTLGVSVLAVRVRRLNIPAEEPDITSGHQVVWENLESAGHATMKVAVLQMVNPPESGAAKIRIDDVSGGAAVVLASFTTT